jgi:hypothetical protein
MKTKLFAKLLQRFQRLHLHLMHPHLPIVQETAICCSDKTEAITQGLSSLCLHSSLGVKHGGPLLAITPGALQAEPRGGTWGEGGTAAVRRIVLGEDVHASTSALEALNSTTVQPMKIKKGHVNILPESFPYIHVQCVKR